LFSTSIRFVVLTPVARDLSNLHSLVPSPQAIDWATSFYKITNVLDVAYTALRCEWLLRNGYILDLSNVLRDEARQLDQNSLATTFVIDPKDVDPVKLSGRTATGARLCSAPPFLPFPL
jgi:hypothetical protein